MRIYAALADRALVIHAARRDQTVAIERVFDALTEISPQCVGADPAQPDRAFVGTRESGLWRFGDGDSSRVDSFDSAHVTAVTVSPHDPDVVWAGTEPSAVYRSDNGGDSWTHCDGLTELPSASEWSFPPRPHTHHVRWLSVNPADETELYVAIEAGAFVRTTDAGQTWIDHPDGGRRDNHTLATHPDAPERIYTAAGDGYAESNDGGENWQYPQDGLDHRYVWGLAVDSGDPNRVLVSAASGANAAHRRGESYVYRKENDHWERAMNGLPPAEGTKRAVLAAGRAGEFFALTNHGLFYTADGADSWTQLDVPGTTIGRGLAVVG